MLPQHGWIVCVIATLNGARIYIVQALKIDMYIYHI
jgi:hypothetical protein